MTNQQDEIAIQKVLNGNVQAYATLVNAYKNKAVTLAYNILLNREDAEEIAQDAFVKAYSSLHAFKGNAAFSTWLYRIIVNTALNKKKLKKHSYVELSETLNGKISAEISTVEATQTTDELKKSLQIALKSLNDKERICITLYYLNEMSVGEINKITRLTKSNIKVLLYRGRKNLYNSMHPYLNQEIIF